MADHNPRIRSRSPSAHDRSPRRSRSPRREENRNRDRDRDRRDRPRGSGGGGGGFRWKTKRPEDRDRNRDGSDRRLERGYRNRSQSPRRERESERESEKHGGRGRDRSSVEDKFGVTNKFGLSSSKTENDKVVKGDHDKPPQRAAPTPAQQMGEPMIVVHVNDRLGTKAAVACLASDPVKLFKAQVAAHIGRQPHEIMLKRQGERPFKDQLTLEDYGISNGVQIDLEIDTGE